MNKELYHHGIKGQRWGLRRYQNPDGSLTAEGRKKYRSLMTKTERTGSKLLDRGENFNTLKKKRSGNTKRTILGTAASIGGVAFGALVTGGVPVVAVSAGIGAVNGVMNHLGNKKIDKQYDALMDYKEFEIALAKGER